MSLIPLNLINYFIRCGVVISQFVSFWIIYSLMTTIKTKTYEAFQYPVFISVIDQFLCLSKFYDLRLMTIIAKYCVFLMLSLLVSYILSLVFLIVNISKLKWNYKCFREALWCNVLLKSYNLISIFSCSTFCIRRSQNNFSRNYHELIPSKDEKRHELIQTLVIPFVGFFVFVYLIKVGNIKLAIFSLLCVQIVMHFLFEVMVIRLLGR
jgi:hypothetical protein